MSLFMKLCRPPCIEPIWHFQIGVGGAESRRESNPGALDSSASGHLDTGETYDACAVREVREELGLDLTATPERLFKMTACLETGQEHVWVYRQQAEGPFSLNPDELEGGGWFAPAVVTRWMQEEP